MVKDFNIKTEHQAIDELNVNCYDSLAFEYDSIEHATCRNFDIANYIFLSRVLASRKIQFHKQLSYLDVGVGTGISLENINRIFNKEGKIFNEVFSIIDVLDISSNMLEVTKRKFSDLIDNYFCNSILSFNSKRKYDIILSTLSDPFLTKESLFKFQKTLVNEGFLILTFPSYNWAKSINREEIDKTTFHDCNGKKRKSYSFCWSNKTLINILDDVNLDVIYLDIIKLNQINDLSDINNQVYLKNPNTNFLTGIVVQKKY